MKSKYIFFYLEIALKDEKDLNVYGYANVSHFPTNLLIEIFNINLKKDPNIVEGYMLTKTRYKKYKKYFKGHLHSMNLDVFEYSLRQYATDDYNQVRRLYKEDLMEDKFK